MLFWGPSELPIPDPKKVTFLSGVGGALGPTSHPPFSEVWDILSSLDLC